MRVDFTLLRDWPTQHLRRGARTVYLSIARNQPAASWRLLEVVSAP